MKSAVLSKNAICAFLKHSIHFHLTYSFTSIPSHAKKLYLHMFDIVDTAFSYERELITCSFLQDFSKGKGSSLQLICNTHTAFLFCGSELVKRAGGEMITTFAMYSVVADQAA